MEELLARLDGAVARIKAGDASDLWEWWLQQKMVASPCAVAVAATPSSPSALPTAATSAAPSPRTPASAPRAVQSAAASPAAPRGAPSPGAPAPTLPPSVVISTATATDRDSSRGLYLQMAAAAPALTLAPATAAAAATPRRHARLLRCHIRPPEQRHPCRARLPCSHGHPSARHPQRHARLHHHQGDPPGRCPPRHARTCVRQRPSKSPAALLAGSSASTPSSAFRSSAPIHNSGGGTSDSGGSALMSEKRRIKHAGRGSDGDSQSPTTGSSGGISSGGAAAAESLAARQRVLARRPRVSGRLPSVCGLGPFCGRVHDLPRGPNNSLRPTTPRPATADAPTRDGLAILPSQHVCLCQPGGLSVRQDRRHRYCFFRVARGPRWALRRRPPLGLLRLRIERRHPFLRSSSQLRRRDCGLWGFGFHVQDPAQQPRWPLRRSHRQPRLRARRLRPRPCTCTAWRAPLRHSTAIPPSGLQQPRRVPDPLRQPRLRLRHPRHTKPRLRRRRHRPHLTEVARDSAVVCLRHRLPRSYTRVGLRQRSSASMPSGVSGSSVPAPTSGGQPPPAAAPPSPPPAVPHAAATSAAATHVTSSHAAPASPQSAPASPAAPWAAPSSAAPVSAPSLSTAPYGGGQAPCKLPKQHASTNVQELLAAPRLPTTSPSAAPGSSWDGHLVATDAATAKVLVAMTPVVSTVTAAARPPAMVSKACLLHPSCRPLHTDLQYQDRCRKLFFTEEPSKPPPELLFLQGEGQASWVSLQQVGRAPPSAPRTIVLVFVINNVSTLAASQLEDELSSKGGEVLLSVARLLCHARPCPPAATQGIILAVADLCNSIRLQHLHLITGPLSVFDWVYCAFPVTLLRQAMEHIQDTASVLFTSPSAGVRHLQVHLWQELGSSSDGPGSAALLSQHLGSSWPTVVVWCLQHTSMISPFSAGNLLRQPD